MCLVGVLVVVGLGFFGAVGLCVSGWCSGGGRGSVRVRVCVRARVCVRVCPCVCEVGLIGYIKKPCPKRKVLMW